MWQFYVYRQWLGPYEYIGKGTEGSNRHLATHPKDRNKFWNNAFKKYGLDKTEILAYFEKEEDAFAFETLKIKEIGRSNLGLGPLLNLTNGGEGIKGCIRQRGYKQTPEHIQKRTQNKRKYRPGKKRGPRSDWTKSILADRAKKQSVNKFRDGFPRVICPYCGKIGAENLMKRWHFNNCKSK